MKVTTPEAAARPRRFCRSRAACAAITLISLAALVGPAVSVASSTPGDSTFSHEGRWITDAKGRVLTLHGLNMVNKIQASGYDPSAIGFGKDDAKFIARHGFNVVRLGIVWKGLEPEPGVYDNAYLDRIEHTYKLLKDQGVAVLLDFHQDLYNERFQGEGAPDWAILGQAATEDPSPQAGFPYNYIAQDAVNHAFDAFWANTKVPGTGRGVQKFYADAWAHVAKRFAGKPGVVGYDLMNEPWMGTPLQQCALAGGGTTADACGVPEFEASKLTAFYKRVKTAVRRVDKRTMVWQEPVLTFNFGFDTGLSKIDARGGFSFHAYCGQADPAVAALLPYVQGAPCSETANIVLKNAVAESKHGGDALLMSEFGAADDPAAYGDYLKAASKRSVSWTYWSYWNRDPSADRPAEGIIHDIGEAPVGANVKSEKVKFLAQPYATQTAGTPKKSDFRGATSRYRYVYGTKPVAGGKAFEPGSMTKISLPRTEYPDGYGVSVRGAEVTSKGGARSLRLKQCRGARKVTVTVKPGATKAGARSCGKG